ncbi:MAG TPA: hypothetical protein VG944_20165, partial [Fimbriimonas sp.]|nr:hypothetical protein [Fimbriimonas sp.]
WGEYQDYYYGRFDGVNHEDEAQTRQNGEKIGHGGDVYYMSPGKNYGKYLSVGVRRALDAGVEAVHLEEPEFWSFGGYGGGFKKEWQEFYHQPWQDPLSSPDARWRAAKLMYYLYRRALQQVFDSVQEYNKQHGAHVRCYVPTHSLINYASWGIVSPESSLARLNGCDGYIAQVWTGTARTPNYYQGIKKERTFETAFLEYGSMQNLVRATGRGVWYLADPIEDNPDHDWGDYRRNYQSTLLASLLQPEVSQYEIMPWPERIVHGAYPAENNPTKRVPIPPAYATELQVVFNALKDMRQNSVHWESGTPGIGVMVSDSLMFERGGPEASDQEMGHLYGLALPFVKRGMPIQPIQLENVGLPHYLDHSKVILMTYEGMKPLSAEVHKPIADWVRRGGTLVFVDADTDPYCGVQEWWNTGDQHFATPREHLFKLMGLPSHPASEVTTVGKGHVAFLRRSPTELSRAKDGASWLVDKVEADAPSVDWRSTSSFVLRRGPYVIAAGMDESDAAPTVLHGTFLDLFDPGQREVDSVTLLPNERHLLVDLDRYKETVVACAGAPVQLKSNRDEWSGTVEGMAETEGVLVLRAHSAPRQATIDGQPMLDTRYDAAHHLLYLRFTNNAKPRLIHIEY